MRITTDQQFDTGQFLFVVNQRALIGQLKFKQGALRIYQIQKGPLCGSIGLLSHLEGLLGLGNEPLPIKIEFAFCVPNLEQSHLQLRLELIGQINLLLQCSLTVQLGFPYARTVFLPPQRDVE